MSGIDTPDGFVSDDGTEVVQDILRRLRGRYDMNRRTYAITADIQDRQAAFTRAEAYVMAITEVV